MPMAVVSMICCWTSLSDVKCSVRDDEGGGMCVDTQENFEIKLAESFGFVISSIREMSRFDEKDQDAGLFRRSRAYGESTLRTRLPPRGSAPHSL